MNHPTKYKIALSPSYDMMRSATAWPCQMYIRHAPEKSGGQEREREVGDRSPMMGKRERQRGKEEEG